MNNLNYILYYDYISKYDNHIEKECYNSYTAAGNINLSFQLYKLFSTVESNINRKNPVKLEITIDFSDIDLIEDREYIVDLIKDDLSFRDGVTIRKI
jgi:hypothetical protein